MKSVWRLMIEKREQAYNEGYHAGADATLDSNPYSRGTFAWDAWRSGWADGNYAVWQSVIMDKRKASTE